MTDAGLPAYLLLQVFEIFGKRAESSVSNALQGSSIDTSELLPNWTELQS